MKKNFTLNNIRSYFGSLPSSIVCHNAAQRIVSDKAEGWTIYFSLFAILANFIINKNATWQKKHAPIFLVILLAASSAISIKNLLDMLTDYSSAPSIKKEILGVITAHYFTRSTHRVSILIENILLISSIMVPTAIAWSAIKDLKEQLAGTPPNNSLSYENH